jgi:threonine/homoserine efflux transporter RhtA
VCGSLIFFLWAYALGRAAPTLVAVSITVNPVTASLFGILLLGETVSLSLMVGLLVVLAGIGFASGATLRRRGGADRSVTPAGVDGLAANSPDHRAAAGADYRDRR